ncbi:MAG: ATP-binding cassette domain-containing protein [Gemmatimonadetes bacterium]|nr:ATP-binding cassette domain-containing protein [Gemmatimonadota bacterium]
MNAALRLLGIRKSFGPTLALDGADLTLLPGTTHALLGENGAGKSTLMHIAAGLLRPDAGTIEIGGTARALRGVREARQFGIGMVHQHFTSVDALTVWENVALAAGWPLKDARIRAERSLAMHGMTLDPDARAGDLEVGSRLHLELAKALAGEPSILLLDEPTGVLTPPEALGLFRTIREFTARGGAVLLVTHKLDEAVEHADAITVLRGGRVTFDRGGASVGPMPDRDTLVVAMLGGTGLVAPPPLRASRGEPVGSATGLTVHAGEVVGIAGVEGNGQRELLRSLATDAFIPEDRTTEGLILEFSLTENLALVPRRAGGTLDWGDLRRRMTTLITAFGIKAPGPDVSAGSLSGGNQQKVVVARALEGRPRLIVAENPARGLDVGAAREVFERLRAAAAAGSGVVFHSTDLDEVTTWADRVVVMAGGRLLVPPEGADRNAIGALMVAGERRE